MIGVQWPSTGESRCEVRGANTTTTSGVTVTATAATADSKGSWANIGATTSFDYRCISIQFLASTGLNAKYVDIGLVVGGNQFVIAENLMIPATRKDPTLGMNYFLPLFIPAGSQLCCRIADNGASSTVAVVIHGYSNGLYGSMACFSRCRSLTTPAAAQGVALDAGATANIKGAYAELDASLAFNTCGLLLTVGLNNDNSRIAATMRFDVAIGGSGSEQIILADIPLAWNTSVDGPLQTNQLLLPAYIPLGTRLAARCQCNTNTAGDRTIDLSAWGFEP